MTLFIYAITLVVAAIALGALWAAISLSMGVDLERPFVRMRVSRPVINEWAGLDVEYERRLLTAIVTPRQSQRDLERTGQDARD